MSLTAAFSALFSAGIPLFLVTFVLVSWALHRGRLVGNTVKELKDGIETLSDEKKGKHQRRNMDPVLGKWFSFGGGFYGVVALYTWLLIEWDDAFDFLRGLGSAVLNVDPGALIALGIELFIESLMNFIVAVTWPAYWLAESRQPWMLLLVGYGGYWLGIKAAQYARERDLIRQVADKVRALFRPDT